MITISLPLKSQKWKQLVIEFRKDKFHPTTLSTIYGEDVKIMDRNTESVAEGSHRLLTRMCNETETGITASNIVAPFKIFTKTACWYTDDTRKALPH